MEVTHLNRTYLCKEPKDDGVRYYVEFEFKPFAAGEFRHAYKGILSCDKRDFDKARYNGGSVVVKVFKEKCPDAGKVWVPDINASKLAKQMAQSFNRQGFTNETIDFQIPFLATMERRAGSRASDLSTQINPVRVNEVVGMEDFLPGTYVKFNNNYGSVCNIPGSTTMQAFSHWTYNQSNGRLLVCDLQGVVNRNNYQLTDPAVNSNGKQGQYGKTDFGMEGQLAFFKTHQCNSICSRWKKPTIPPESQTMTRMNQYGMSTMFLFNLFSVLNMMGNDQDDSDD